MTIQTETRATSWSISFTDLGALAGRTALYFTIKTRNTDADDNALVKIEETAGLQIIAGETAETPGNGVINVTDAVAGDLTVTLAAVETAKLTACPNALYDLKMVTAAAVSVLTSDRFNIASVTTEAVT